MGQVSESKPTDEDLLLSPCCIPARNGGHTRWEEQPWPAWEENENLPEPSHVCTVVTLRTGVAKAPPLHGKVRCGRHDPGRRQWRMEPFRVSTDPPTVRPQKHVSQHSAYPGLVGPETANRGPRAAGLASDLTVETYQTNDDATFPGTFRASFLSHASLPEFPDTCGSQHPSALSPDPARPSRARHLPRCPGVSTTIQNQTGPTLWAPWLQRLLILRRCYVNNNARELQIL